MPDEPSTPTPPEGGSTTEAAFAPITSQDDLNRVIGERLRQQRAQYADYQELKTKATEFDKLAESQKSELEKAAERATKAEERAARAEGDALRLRVATTKGLPPDLADRLRGDSEDDLNADAERLLAVFGGGRAPAAFDHGARPGGTAPASMNDVIVGAIQGRR